MIHSKKMKFAVTAAATTAVVCTSALAVNVTSTADLNVRSGPGTSYSVVTVMKKGTSATKLEQHGNWAKVSVNGKTGFASMKYLTGTPGSQPKTNETVYVTASSLNVRSGAGTNYSVIGNLKKGASATVVSNSNGWSKIKYGSGYGYISSQYTSGSKPSGGDTSTPSVSGKTMYCNVSGLNVRSGKGTSYSVIGSLSHGQSATVVDTSDSWYKIKYGNGYGYASSKYLSSTKPDGSTDVTPPVTDAPTNGSEIVNYAKRFLGLPYVYGGNGPDSFDCSGFTKYVYKHFGKNLPRTSADQYAKAKKISKSNLQPGDLVFFTNGGSSVGHVAIYMGNGKIIHAANPKRGVCTDSLNSTYYTQHYVGSGRY